MTLFEITIFFKTLIFYIYVYDNAFGFQNRHHGWIQHSRLYQNINEIIQKDLLEASRNSYGNYDNQGGDTFNYLKKFDGKNVYYQNMYWQINS